jgi:hypothetical protein
MRALHRSTETASRPPRLAQVGRRGQPERSEATRGGDGTGQLRARQATTHSGLRDRNVKAKSVQQVH